MKTETVKVRAGNYLVPLTLIYNGKRIWCKFRFNKKLMAEIKAMEGARWHGYDEKNPKKMWSIANSARNKFQLDYLQGKNPYGVYDMPLIYDSDESFKRPLYKHQKEMVAQGLTRHYCIFACEMGTGKTLAAIEIMERADLKDQEVWYVGPKSGTYAVERELRKWNSRIRPRMFTYEGLVKEMRYWEDGRPAPRMAIMDESSKIKTPTAQRSQACRHLAEAIRSEHGDNGFIICMSGTPAPKNPTDWWHQCEVACPGFLREGNVNKFKARLCLIEERQSITGGVYPHIVTWLDDESKCAVCGQLKNHEYHLAPDDFTKLCGASAENYHPWQKSKNEVDFLYQRLKGLVLVQFKKDCLDLPDKRYEEIQVMPTPEVLRAAKLISTKSTRAIQALTLLRELSDGFQYTEERVGEEVCPLCKGSGKYLGKSLKEGTDPEPVEEEKFIEEEIVCDNCGGSGKVPQYRRGIDEVSCPKDKHFINELDQHEDVGRYIVWGGFTGTIDRLVRIAQKYEWAVLRVDGRGYVAWNEGGIQADAKIYLDAMDLSHPDHQKLLQDIPKLCFVGHPQAGGMALTLTSSPTELFYSNCFNGEARMQAEDRFHRMGMDTNRGATIKDLIHLPTDKLVLDNLKLKKKLQNISMGELENAFK
jgi:hypothetical protein